MQDDLDQFNASMETMGINLHETKDLITDMKSQLQDTVDTLTELRDGDGYQVLMELLSTDPDTIGSFMSAPVEIETEAIYPIDYYGSAMSPFYSVLAIWVGSLILVAIIHVGVKPLPGVGKVKAAESYVGRYLTFFLIGQAQALLTVLGDLYYVGIQCLHPFKFWLAASMASFVFTLFSDRRFWKHRRGTGGCDYGNSGGRCRWYFPGTDSAPDLSGYLQIPALPLRHGCHA